MKYLSVCSGIEAASVAWHGLGWIPVAFSEIAPFPCAVLQHRFPHVPNLRNLENFEAWEFDKVDVVVGGTPCQSFSVFGLKGGLTDARGNLALIYCRLLQKLQPKWFIWENVPGALSSNGGRDFGSILGEVAKCGYGYAWRVLDAKYYGVPQKRRRIFLIGHLGDWRSAAKVLFEPNCMQRDTTTSGEKEKDSARIITSYSRTNGRIGTDINGNPIISSSGHVSHCLNAGSMGRQDYETETLIGGPNGVRRFTPVECERLQGFPDNWTLVQYRGKLAQDGPRYKAIGNSIAVPVMRSIGEKINDQ